MQLSRGQTAVVTGAASGIGLALCKALAQRGLNLCMLDVEATALRAAAELGGDALAVEAIVCDVADAAAMGAAAARIHERFGSVELLVNNAGVGGLLGPVWSSPPEDWRWVFEVNVHGVVNGVRAFAPRMLGRGQGHILNIASLAGLTAPPFLAPYTASKHAVIALSESLAAEFAAVGSGVGVSVACPANVRSRIHDADRNRPPELSATSGADPALLALIRPVFDEVMQRDMMDADEAAARLLEGVEAEAFYILTHPGQQDAAQERLDRLGAALAA